MGASTPVVASSDKPYHLSKLIVFTASSLAKFVHSYLPSWVTPFMSRVVVSFAPVLEDDLVVTVPTTPTPLVAVFVFSVYLSADFGTFFGPTTIAVTIPY